MPKNIIDVNISRNAVEHQTSLWACIDKLKTTKHKPKPKYIKRAFKYIINIDKKYIGKYVQPPIYKFCRSIDLTNSIIDFVGVLTLNYYFKQYFYSESLHYSTLNDIIYNIFKYDLKSAAKLQRIFNKTNILKSYEGIFYFLRGSSQNDHFITQERIYHFLYKIKNKYLSE